MNIFYFLTVIIIIAAFFLFKKTDKELNGLSWLVLSIGAFLAYNLIITFVFYFLHIRSSLLILGITNLLVSIGLLHKYFTNRKDFKFQKYYFYRKEIIGFLIVFVVTLVLSLVRFDNLNSIKYETTDPTLHYQQAEKFSEVEFLLDKDNSTDEMYNSFFGQTGSYVNGGLFIKTLSFIPSYKAFIIFDIFCFILAGLLFNITINEFRNSKFVKKKNDNKGCLIFTVSLSLLYVLGYPLNNMIFGFYYLGIGITYINFSVLIFYMLVNNINNIKKWVLITLLFLFNYSIFFSYYLFVPVCYLAMGLYFVYRWLRKKETFKNTFLIGSVTLIIPFILGFCYLLLPGLIQSSGMSGVSTLLASEGYIYRDFWGNFVLLIPIVIYSIIMQIKTKKNDIVLIILVILLAFIIYVFILGMMGNASSYYYFKLYYFLWLVIWLTVAKVLVFDDSQSKVIMFSFLASLFIVYAFAFLHVEERIMSKNINFNPYVVISRNLSNIYIWNKDMVFDGNSVLDSNDLRLISESERYYSDCNVTTELPVSADYLKKLWYYSITDVAPIYQHTKGSLFEFYEKKLDYKKWSSDNESKCLLYFNDSDADIENDKQKYNVLYENESGFLIAKK